MTVLAKFLRPNLRKGTKKISKRDLARRGAASEKFDIVLFDESHALKNLSALRSKFSIKLYESAKMIFWLSATAGQNPLELGYLLPILAKKTGDRALTTKDFEQWCAQNLPGVSRGAFGAWAWAGGKEDEAEIRRLLFDPDKKGVKAALRRRPADLIGWPEVNRIVHFVELDGKAKHLYRLAWKEFKKALEGIGSLSKQRATLVQNEAVIRLRQKSSLLKVEDTIELCQELLDNGRQVAISCEFLATMDAMEEALAKKKIEHARVDGQRTKTSQSKESRAAALSARRSASHALQHRSKESRCTKAKPTTAETMSPAVKSIMICDGPQSRLTRSTDAATATGSLPRSIGWSPKRRLTPVSPKSS